MSTPGDATKRPLPDGWRWVKLGEVCDINPRRPSNFERDDNAPTSFVPMAAVDEIHGVIAKAEVRLYSQVKKGYTFFAEKDVLFAKITPCMQNGKHAIADNLIDGIGFGTTEFHVLRPRTEVLSEWIHSFIRQTWVLKNAEAHFTGSAGQQRVPEKFLSDLVIPLPPVEEQQRIAAKLREQMAAVEQARRAAEEQLEAAKALPAALLRQIFPRSGQSLPEGWRWVKLGEICRVVGGSTPSSHVQNYWDGDIVWITPKDLGQLKSPVITSSERRITKEGYESCCTELVPVGTVVLSSRAPIGHVGIAGVPLCTNQGCKSFVPSDQVHSFFLYFSLKTSIPKLKALGSGATFTEISKADLEGFEIPLPPVAEQQRIAAILREQMAAAERARQAIEEQLEAIHQLPAAILQKAFNGEL